MRQAKRRTAPKKKVAGGPLTLRELLAFCQKHQACLGGIEHIKALMNEHGNDAPARLAYDDDNVEGSHIEWLADEATSKFSATDPRRLKYLEGSSGWGADDGCNAAAGRRHFAWDDIERWLWESGEIPRRPPDVTGDLEKRVAALEAAVRQMKRNRVLERGARRAR